MNADKFFVFICFHRRSSAAIHVLAFFGSLARLRTISLHLFRIRRRVWQLLRLHHPRSRNLLSESVCRARRQRCACGRSAWPCSAPLTWTRHPPAENPALGPCYDRYLSGLGLRATDGCKPRQVRKEATVVVRFVCRGLPGPGGVCPRGNRIPTPCTR